MNWAQNSPDLLTSGNAILLSIESIKSLEFVLIFLVPGVVALYARSQFLTGRQPDLKEAAPTYAVITLAYYGLVFPFTEYVVSLEGDNLWRAWMWIILVMLGPLLFGSGLGFVASFGLVKRIVSRLGISLVHPIPTAWDYKLSKREEQYGFVTMKNGIKFAGIYGSKSFASSDTDERDLYLEQIFDWKGPKPWKVRQGNGVWLTGAEIQSIEFK